MRSRTSGLRGVEARALRPFISLGARRMIIEGLQTFGTLTAATTRSTGCWRDFSPTTKPTSPTRAARSKAPSPALEDLKSAGAKLAVCTNKREALSRQLLDALDIAHLFDAIAGRDTFPVSKPHPDHLTGAIRMAGGDARRAIMVGDTIVDIETARSANVPSIVVTFGYSDEPVDKLKADISINHYRDLMRAVRTLRPPLIATFPGLTRSNISEKHQACEMAKEQPQSNWNDLRGSTFGFRGKTRDRDNRG